MYKNKKNHKHYLKSRFNSTNKAAKQMDEIKFGLENKI